MPNFLLNVVVVSVVLGVAYGLWNLFTLRSRRADGRRDSIKAAGRMVWATVVSKQPTGQSTGSDTHMQRKVQYYVLLQLDVPQPDGTMARSTIQDLPAPDWKPLEPGDQVRVYQDVDDPMQIALDTIVTPRYAPSPLR